MTDDTVQVVPSTNKVLIESKNLVKAYKGRRVVNGVSMMVHEGEVVGLLGAERSR